MTRFLVADDSLTIRMDLEEALAGLGGEVLLASDLAGARRVLAGGAIDLVVLDIQFPDGNGLDLLAEIRDDPATASLPVILLSSRSAVADRIDGWRAGAQDYAGKPYDRDDLVARARDLTEGTAGRDPSSRRGATRVLSVDDSETFLQEMAGDLREEGYEVLLARSGEEALRILAGQPIDCVLLDLVMPGLSGLETCRRIKSSPEWCDIPVLLLTGREDRAAMLDGIESGADDYIAKSSDFEVVRTRIRAQLRRRRFEDETRRIREDLHRAEERVALLSEIEAKNVLLERRNAELREFVHVASHDLQSPLRAIGRFSQILEQRYRGRLDDRADEYLGLIVGGVARMEALIEGLLAYSRVTTDARPIAPVDLEVALDGALANLRADIEDCQARVERGPLPTVPGNLVQLVQVFQNLVGNALKYRSDGPPAVRVDAARQGSEWILRVEDDGIGIDPRHFDRIFQIFKRLHRQGEYGGTGVGLSICRKVIERHGGRIWVESEPGAGSRFLFTLPDGSEDRIHDG